MAALRSMGTRKLNRVLGRITIKGSRAATNHTLHPRSIFPFLHCIFGTYLSSVQRRFSSCRSQSMDISFCLFLGARAFKVDLGRLHCFIFLLLLASSGPGNLFLCLLIGAFFAHIISSPLLFSPLFFLLFFC